MEVTINTRDDVCTGCLSRGRRLTHLNGAAAELFNEIIVSAGGSVGGAVCWECKARVHSSIKFRSMVTTAAQALNSCQSNVVNYITSLSGLSCHTTNYVIEATHDEDVATEGQQRSPLFVKMEDDVDSYMDDTLAFDGVDLDADIKAVLKNESNQKKDRLKNNSSRKKKRHKDKSKKTEKNKDEVFNESDDEPLASKTVPVAEDVKASSGGGGRGRGRREGAAGVVRNPRVEARLAGLGVTPGALDMIALTWEEVEAEKQRALSSDSYLRHTHRCERCALGFNHHLKLERHMEKHQPAAGEYECSVCHVRFRTTHALAAHRRRHRVRWRCGSCGALSSRAAVAADHLRRAHPPEPHCPAPSHTCPTCLHKAPTLNKLRAHMRAHAPRQPCPECGKVFRDRGSLRTHLFSHVADKEHYCGQCPARFLYPRALRLHRLTHDPPAPFYCHQCDTQFKNPMSYYQHMKYSLKHVHPDQLKHVCEVCGAKFVRAARLADHVAARHTHRAPHHCEHKGCDYRSASRAVLRAHARSVHSPRAPRTPRARLVCHLCGHTYTTKKSLERHLRTHSNSGLPSRAEQTKRDTITINATPTTDSVRFYTDQPSNTTHTYKTVQKET